MPTSGSISVIDYSNEISTIEPNLPDANTPAQNFTALGNVAAEAFNDALILGYPVSYSQSFRQASGLVGAVNSGAQRELKWAITVRDTSQYLDPPTNSVANPFYGRYFTMTLPTANNSLLAQGTDILPLTATAAVDTVAAIEAGFVSPVGGTLVVTQIKLVGRNL